MISLDERMSELLEETASWPETDRIAHVKAEMAKMYASIHARDNAAMIAKHNAKFARRPRRVH